MADDVADKVAVVTGASRGLGRRVSERDWPEAQRARYRELVAQQGYYAASGEPISPQITAQAIVDLIGLPRAACVDCIELRPS